MSKGVTIVAPDTDAGKTWITSHLLKALLEKNSNCMVMKPVQTGAIVKDGIKLSEDIEKCREISGVHIPFELYDTVVPFNFSKPCSPHLAAELDKEPPIDLGKIISSYTKLIGMYDLLLVETAGGILSPLTRRETVLDMVQKIGSPVIIVAPNKLGAISQTLATIELVSQRAIPISAVIMNDMLRPQNEFEELLLTENIEAISQFSNIQKIYRTPHTKDSTIITEALETLVESLL